MRTRTPLDDVEFLARSKHRVRVLDVLTEGPTSRRDLHERTGVSQATLGRVLGAFRERGWIEKRGQEFLLTPFGTLLVESFDHLLETVETTQRFRDISPHLPLEECSFDLREFADATVTLPQTEDVLAHVRRSEDVIANGDEVHLLSPSIHQSALRELHERLAVREQVHEAILSASALDVVAADPEFAALARDVVAAEGVSVYRYDGAIPYALGTVDDLAVIFPFDANAIPCALVESRNERIREWVATTLEEYREASTLVTIEDFPD